VGVLALFALLVTFPATAADQAQSSTYVGRAECAECHPKQDVIWPATPQTGLGDFSGVTLTHYGVTSRF
jgi:hypothetical protein